MKKLTFALAISLLATPLVSRGQISTVFQDTFPSGALSTLNPTATSPGTHTSARTAYEIASSKSATSTTIASGVMTFGNFSTSSGYCEGQALFTTSPITLNSPGEYIEFYYTFTDTTTLFNGNVNDNEQVSLGLYNSGGSGPTNGAALWNSGLSSGLSTGDIGCAKGWLGYCGMIAYSKANSEPSAIYTRPAQVAANNDNQGLCPVSGYSSGVNLGQLSSVVGQPALTAGNQYTLDFKIYYLNSSTLAITNTLYVGAGVGGPVFSAGGFTAQNFASVSGTNLLTSTFDGLCIGFRPTSSPTTAETMQINNVTVLLGTPIAPGITGLTNETVVAGTSPTLSPTVTAVPAPAYQWYVSTDGGATSNALAYATSSSLTLTNAQYSQNNYIYSLVAANPLGTNASSMTLSVIVPPSITGLNNQSASVGDTVTISPTVSGEPAPTLQWQTNHVNLADGTDANGSIIAGSTTGTLYITNAQTADSVTYSLIASNSAGKVTNSMTLTVAAGNQLPVIVGPTNITVVQGNNGIFSASASGVPVPTLQWLDQTGTPIMGATNSTLTLMNVQYSQNGYSYSIVASNTVGSVTNSATLTVLVPPAITSQPTSLVVTSTQTASFTVGATGVPAVAYQWYKGTNAISIGANSTANSATLTIASASSSDIGTYSVTITNLVGTTNSASVTLTVNSTTILPTAMSPANGATGICYDTPLTITFNQTPTIGKTGRILIYNVTNSTTPVETIDLSLNNVAKVQARSFFSGDGQQFNYYPVVVTGNTAAIYPHSSSVMTSNQTYYVTIDDGVFADPTGAYFPGLTATNAWQFTTKPAGPVDPVNPVVNHNGSADFVTVQGAVDSLATNAAGLRRTIFVDTGFYFEIVDIASKTNVTLRGQSRTGSVIKYPNNANIAPGGTTHARMTFKVNANDVAIENLTISNSTPQGGGQAEALMVEGNSSASAAKRCIINNCEIDSRQDTVLANINASQAFFYNSEIKGNFDYVWGGGNLFFLNCILHTISGTSTYNLTAARTDNSSVLSTNDPWVNPNGVTYSANGFSFMGCTLEADSGVSGITLADGNGNVGGLVSWSFSKINTNAYVSPSLTLSNTYVFWQSQNTDTNGVNPVSYTNVQTIGITNNDPRLLAATNIPMWFYGWTPALLPNIISQPVNQAVSAGQSTSFAVSATGIPDPTYQWLQNGAPISGATSATYNITSAVRTNGGNYSVVVSNGSGSVTSSVAVLTYSNTPPVAGPASYTRNVAVYQLNISITNLLANVTDVDGDAITLVSVGVSTNGVTSVISGNYVIYYNTNAVADQFTYTVTDGFGGTNSALVTVNVSTQPLFGQGSPAISTSSGSAILNYAGIPGYSYSVQRSTNVDFSSDDVVLTTNVPAGGVFQFIDSSPPQPTAYYRLLYNP